MNELHETLNRLSALAKENWYKTGNVYDLGSHIAYSIAADLLQQKIKELCKTESTSEK